jgi:hypothetical protein
MRGTQNEQIFKDLESTLFVLADAGFQYPFFY